MAVWATNAASAAIAMKAAVPASSARGHKATDSADTGMRRA